MSRKDTRTYSDRREYNKAAVVKRRRKMKRLLVNEHGGKCIRCGFNEHVCALEFHHRDPSQKEGKIIGSTASLDRQRAEALKCDLLCSNCHKIIHYGL